MNFRFRSDEMSCQKDKNLGWEKNGDETNAAEEDSAGFWGHN